MSPRRVALALVVALTAATSALGATAARAASNTICVALVVDATSIGSNVSTGCATVSKNATGIDVLDGGGHSLTFRHDGLLCTIDGLPSTGCDNVDDTHYWAYFHRAPGTTNWVYSSEGAATYQPANTSTEGWVYRDGTSLKPPTNVPYAKICTTKTTPSPTPKPSHKPTKKPTHKPTTQAKPHHPKTSSPTPTATPTPTASKTRTPTRHHSPGDQSKRHQSKQHHPTSEPKPTTTPTPGPVTSGRLRPVSHGAASFEADPESHVLLKLLVGIAVVVGLVVLAFSGFRRKG